MRSTKKQLRLWLILPLSFLATGIMAQTTNSAAADTGKTGWMIVGAVAVILMIMNLKHSLKRAIKYLSINLFTKKALNYEKN
jgi:hypothetical protein